MVGTSTQRGRIAWLAGAAIAAQALFIGGWLVFGALEGHGYSAGRHDVSDLGALTAHHAGAVLATEGISGAITLAFAIWALRPALTLPGGRPPIGAWLVAASLPAIDNLGDVFFRLDCRAADGGCTTSQAAASWHGKAHLIVFVIAAIPTLIAPFALARRMRLVDGWGDLARPAQLFGVAVVVGMVINGGASGSGLQGWAQRALIVFVCGGIAVLAARVLRLMSQPSRESARVRGASS